MHSDDSIQLHIQAVWKITWRNTDVVLGIVEYDTTKQYKIATIYSCKLSVSARLD